MLARRLLALCLTVCVAVGFVVAPAGASVRLVCRMTGRPMAPILRAAGARGDAAARRPCCVVTVRQTPAGEARFTLAERSCCDLRLRAAHDPLPPALPALAQDAPVAALPAAPVIPTGSVAVTAAVPTLSAHPAGPRAPPPLESFSPRAPPTFS